jgi:hypothetical protein
VHHWAEVARFGKVVDRVDEGGRLLREFDIEGLLARVIALDGEGTIWRVEVGGSEAGVRQRRGTLEEATWLAVRVARELKEAEAESPLSEPLARPNLDSA